MIHSLGIIPARYASTRFPGKPLALLGDRPMIQWVFERASGIFSRLVVATDDARIKETVEAFGGEALMTSSSHDSGTERCAEALELYQEIHGVSITRVVNIQGDEPLLDPGQLEILLSCLEEEGTQIATLIHPVEKREELTDPNIVKVVVDHSFRALYFSRSPIPYVRDRPGGDESDPVTFYRHIGLYAYHSNVLNQLVRLPPSPLEKAESLEQLRWLAHGYTIRTKVAHGSSTGVDTPEDLEKIRKLI